MESFGIGASSPFWRLSVDRVSEGRPEYYSREDERVGVRFYETDADEKLLIAHGDPAEAQAELERVAEIGRPDRALVSVEIQNEMNPDLRAFFGPRWGFNWDLYFAAEPLPAVPHSDSIELIEHGTVEAGEREAEILDLLRVANPITDAIEHVSELDWYVKYHDGRLASVVGMETVDGIGRLHGLGTRPEYRGLGYGSATMVGAFNLALASHEAVQLGMWSWNAKARGIYERIGLRHGGQQIIGRREAFPNLEGSL